MARKSGVVQAIESKTSNRGSAYHRIQAGGAWYTTWEPVKFAVGQTIEFDEIVKGNFKNIANVEVGTDAAIPARTDQSGRGAKLGLSEAAERESRIVRQNATSSAIALLAVSKAAGKQDAGTLLQLVRDTAKRLYHMNMFGYDEPEAEPLPGEKEHGAEALFQP